MPIGLNSRWNSTGRGGGLADGDGVRADQQETGDQDGGEAEELGPVDPSHETGEQVQHPHRHLPRGARGGVDGTQVTFLHAVGVHRPHALHALHQPLRRARDRDALPGVVGGGPGQVPAQRQRVQRHRDGAGQAEPPVEAGHRGQAQRAEQERGDHAGDDVGDGLGDLGGVRADAGQQVALARAFQPGEREREGTGDRTLAQGGEDLAAQPRHQVGRHPGGRAAGEGRQRDDHGDRDDHRGARLLAHPVDEDAHHVRGDDRRRRAEHAHEQRHGHRAAALAQFGAQPAPGLGAARDRQQVLFSR
ncbi:hypothetical protein GCM10018952_71200 [Streptosporangium vulgare]